MQVFESSSSHVDYGLQAQDCVVTLRSQEFELLHVGMRRGTHVMQVCKLHLMKQAAPGWYVVIGGRDWIAAVAV